MDDTPWQAGLDAPAPTPSPGLGAAGAARWDEASTSSTPATPLDDANHDDQDYGYAMRIHADATHAHYLRLGVVGSIREADAQGPYISYQIQVETNSPALERVSHIQRRYGDFAALHAALRTEEAACVVPPLPPARAVEQVTGGSRLGHTFVQLRQGELTLFLRRVARHPTLRLCRAFMSFLSPHWRGDPAHSEWVWALAPTPASLEAQRKQLVRSRRDLEHLHRALQRERNELAAHLFSLPDFPDPFAPALDLPPPDDLSDGYGDMAGAVQLLAGLESGMAPALFKMADGLRRMGQLLTHDAKGTDNLCHGLGEIIALLQAGEEAISRAGRLESKADALQRTLDDRGLKVFVQTRWDTLRGKPDSVVQLERAERRQEAERALATTRADIANALERLGSQEPEWLRVEQELELRELLQDWTRSKVACSEAAVTAWDEVLDVLEAPLGA